MLIQTVAKVFLARALNTSFETKPKRTQNAKWKAERDQKRQTNKIVSVLITSREKSSDSPSFLSRFKVTLRIFLSFWETNFQTSFCK